MLEKPILTAVAIVGAASAVVVAMQVHLWQARATDVQAWPTGDMSSFISQLHASGYTKHLPVQVFADPL
jgi:hypothetical protein